MKHDDGADSAEKTLRKVGIKPTSNRILVLRELEKADGPMSLIELETSLETMERSSVLRVLNLFLEKDVVHAVEDGRGITKYEICRGEEHCSVDDMHAHFYCERCHHTFCLEECSAPLVDFPEGFKVRSVNYMLKGLCPECSAKV